MATDARQERGIDVDGEPIYLPPYDSPLEDLFAYNITKYLHDSVRLERQVEVKTICGVFRMDFVADCGAKRVAFECDGRDYHDGGRDEWRDAMILDTGSVDVIYRLRGSDLHTHLEDCLFAIRVMDRELFSERGLVNLETLASAEARKTVGIRRELTTIRYHGLRLVWIFRRTRGGPEGFREGLVEYAKAHGGGNLDGLMESWKEDLATGRWRRHWKPTRSF
jgi:hypothetical protein